MVTAKGTYRHALMNKFWCRPMGMGAAPKNIMETSKKLRNIAASLQKAAESIHANGMTERKVRRIYKTVDNAEKNLMQTLTKISASDHDEEYRIVKNSEIRVHECKCNIYPSETITVRAQMVSATLSSCADAILSVIEK